MGRSFRYFGNAIASVPSPQLPCRNCPQARFNGVRGRGEAVPTDTISGIPVSSPLVKQLLNV
jgi:hypothetical protein